MSSKVRLPGDPAETGPVLWRRVNLTESGVEPLTGETAPPSIELEPEPPPPDAEAIRAEMRAECELKLREVRTAALREGEATGRTRATAEIEPVLERLTRSIDEIGHLHARYRKEAEGDMVRLALAIARRVLRREVAMDPDALHGLVLGALEKLRLQEISRVRVHPALAAQVTAHLRKISCDSPVEVVSDPAREPGAVIFETDRGNLDASVDTQLQEIERGLIDRLSRQT